MVIGVVLSAVPVFPIAFVGFLVDLFNLHLFKAKKLDRDDGQLARRALFLSLISMTISLLITYWLLHLVFGLDWSGMLDHVAKFFDGIPLVNRVIQPGHRGVQTI